MWQWYSSKRCSRHSSPVSLSFLTITSWSSTKTLWVPGWACTSTMEHTFMEWNFYRFSSPVCSQTCSEWQDILTAGSRAALPTHHPTGGFTPIALGAQGSRQLLLPVTLCAKNSPQLLPGCPLPGTKDKLRYLCMHIIPFPRKPNVRST